MAVAVAQQRTTPEDLLTMPDGEHHELVDGELVEKNMGTESGWIGGRLVKLLSIFVDEGDLGWVFPAEASYQCFDNAPSRVRRPDVSFIRRGRLPGGRIPKGHTRIVPDLAVEVVSPNDHYSEVQEKAEEYLRAGVALVWIVDPDNRLVEVLRADGSVSRLREPAALEGEEVLPGFRCAVAEIFPPVALPDESLREVEPA